MTEVGLGGRNAGVEQEASRGGVQGSLREAPGDKFHMLRLNGRRRKTF